MHFLRLTRPLNLIITAITMYGLGWYAESFYINGEKYGIRSLDFFLLVFSTLLIAAAGNVINDYFDVRADRVNKPEKLIIGVYVKRRWAIISHWLFNVIAFGIAIYLSWKQQTFWYLFVHLLSINLLWGYSSYFKRKPAIGNIVVAALTALVPILVSIYFHIQPELAYNEESGSYPFNKTYTPDVVLIVSVILAIFAFILNLTREIVKDIQDIPGDQLLRAKTLPIVFGIKTTKIICYLIITVTLASLFYFEMYFTISDFNALIPIWIATAALLTALFMLVFAQDKQSFKRVDLFMKLTMIAGLLAPVYWKYLFFTHA